MISRSHPGIACNEVDLLLFFRDPINAKPSEPNEMTLLRLCDVHNIPLATNIATAEVLIHGLERGGSGLAGYRPPAELKTGIKHKPPHVGRKTNVRGLFCIPVMVTGT